MMLADGSRIGTLWMLPLRSSPRCSIITGFVGLFWLQSIHCAHALQSTFFPQLFQYQMCLLGGWIHAQLPTWSNTLCHELTLGQYWHGERLFQMWVHTAQKAAENSPQPGICTHPISSSPSRDCKCMLHPTGANVCCIPLAHFLS